MCNKTFILYQYTVHRTLVGFQLWNMLDTIQRFWCYRLTSITGTGCSCQIWLLFFFFFVILWCACNWWQYFFLLANIVTGPWRSQDPSDWLITWTVAIMRPQGFGSNLTWNVGREVSFADLSQGSLSCCLSWAINVCKYIFQTALLFFSIKLQLPYYGLVNGMIL